MKQPDWNEVELPVHDAFTAIKFKFKIKYSPNTKPQAITLKATVYMYSKHQCRQLISSAPLSQPARLASSLRAYLSLGHVRTSCTTPPLCTDPLPDPPRIQQRSYTSTDMSHFPRNCMRLFGRSTTAATSSPFGENRNVHGEISALHEIHDELFINCCRDAVCRDCEVILTNMCDAV